MKKSALLLLTAFVAVFVHLTVGRAFFEEVVVLRQELQAWETAHAADFSDIVAQLQNMTGPVFRDVAESDWFNPYVLHLAEWGIVSGYRNAAGQLTGEFRPGNPVTIAEALKMVLMAAKVDLSQCTHAPRHAEAAGHWAAPYVACAERMDMRLFRTGAPPLDSRAKRAEVIAMINDAFHEDVLPLYSNFRDTAGHPLESDIAYAALLGIVSGDRDARGNLTGMFRPDADINRAEVAKIIYEKVKEQVKKEMI